jgi:hypothetical protein
VRIGPAANQWTASQTAGALTESGVDVNFANVKGQVVRVEIGAVTGRAQDGSTAASLAEVEVIANAGTPGAPSAPSNRAPTIRIDSPANGASITEGAVALRAAASDPEDGDLAAKIVWRSSLGGEIGRGASISPALTAGAHTITASVSDAQGVSANASISLTITAKSTINERAVVTILTPSKGATMPEGSVGFRGSATDKEDGDLSSKMVWRSDLMGELGRGASITANMTAGNHAITAFVIDSGNKGGGITMPLTVTKSAAANTAPAVRILSPASGSSVTEGAMAFRGSASDAEDGDLSAKLVWRSNLAGEIGRGASISANLTAGNHTITAYVTDSKNVAASASIALTVNRPAAANTAPTVRILSPASGITIKEGPATLTATAADPQDGSISNKIVWRSNLAGEIGRGAVITTTLKAGRHTITASAADSKGAAGSASILVIVEALPKANQPPSITILQPTSGTTVKAGERITLSAKATDPEDGDLSSKVVWYGGPLGYLGTGNNITTSLKPGQFWISGRVFDSGGFSSETKALVTVTR